MTSGSSAQGDLGSGRRPFLGLATILVGAVLLGGFVLGLTAGVGAIWSRVATPASAQPAAATGPGYMGGAVGRGMVPGQGMGPGDPVGNPATSPSSRPSTHAAAAAQPIRLVVDPPPLGGVYGPDGKPHDAFVPATFTMVAGETYKVTVVNYDAMPHTWTSSALGVNATVPPGSATAPSTTTFTIHPTRAGTFTWYCATPCDSWSMVHNGYMRGTVTVEEA